MPKKNKQEARTIPADINYDHENCCQCHHNGLEHRWRERDKKYRCTISGCSCVLFTPMCPEEIRARNEVLKSDPRQFAEVKTRFQPLADDPESRFIQGPHRLDIRKTFDRARPTLEKVFQQIPDLDQGLIFECLAEQTRIAMDWLTRDYRNQVRAWKKFCKAWDELCRAMVNTPTLDQLKDAFKLQAKKGIKLNREPERVWADVYKKWPDWLEDLRLLGSFPMPEAKGKKGRPDTFWIDAQNQKLVEHFRQVTGSPHREIVQEILSFAPTPQGVSIDSERVRERTRKRSKQDRHIMRLAT